MGHGNRQVLQQLLVPFKAAVDLGGARGVMMAYSEWDDIPSSVHPMLYEALDDWGFEGFVISDDTGMPKLKIPTRILKGPGMSELQYTHMVSDSPADTIMQWFNAGGMISFYDYPLDVYLNVSENPHQLPRLKSLAGNSRSYRQWICSVIHASG